jgi:TatD DNase family protein
MFIDAHCHLEQETYGSELDDVIQRARDAGLSHFVAVGASRVTGGAHEAVALAERLPFVYASVGIHPHEAASATPEHMADIEELLTLPKVVSLGEVGLDYYYDNSPREQQQAIFREFLKMARRANKPIMLHIRDAHEDAWRLLDEEGLPERGGVVHCFTGGPKEAKEYLERGMHLSIPGVITFKSAENLREAVSTAPLDKLFLETDCPYLAPVPHRGKRNEPAFITATAAAVAALRDMSAADLGEQTSSNARAFFGLN